MAKTYCGDLISKVYNDSASELNELLEKRLNRFTQVNLVRKKRFVLEAMLITAGIGLAAGFFLGKGSSDNSEKIRELGESIARQHERTKLIENAMIGLAEATDLRFEETENRIRILSNATKKQFEIMNNTFSLRIQGLERSFKKFVFTQDITNFAKSGVDKLQNLLITYLETMQYWDKIFINLRKGLLPRELIDMAELSRVLAKVESSLKNIYKIGFERSDWINFYNLPFVAYTLAEEVSNGKTNKFLYIKFKIPIKRNSDQNQFHIITPNNMPFPCDKESECLIGSESKKKLISFKLEQNVWLLNPKNSKIDFEADPSHFSCHRTFDSQLCFTYSSELLRIPSPCTQAIIRWIPNGTELLANCEFTHRDEGDYRIIKLNDFQFMLHGKLIGTVSEKCPDEQRRQRTFDSWATVVSVRKGCEINVAKTGQQLLGAFSEPLSGQAELKNIDIFSPLIEKITKKLTESQFQSKELDDIFENKSIPIYNTEIWDTMMKAIDNDKIKDLNKVSIKITKKLSEDLQKLDSRFTTFTFKSSFWSIFSIMGDFLMVSITILVLFTTLTYSRFFGMLGLGIEIVRPIQVEAFNLMPDIHILPEISVDLMEDVTFITWISKVILVSVFLILIIVSCKTKWFRTVKLTYHYGHANNFGNGRFAIQLNIYNKTQYFRYISVENIYVKIPIVVPELQGVFEVKCKNTIVTWFVSDEGNKELKVHGKIFLIGFDNKGQRCRNKPYSQEVQIPISSIIWTSNPIPRSLLTKNNFDFAHINIIKEPYNSRAQPSVRFQSDSEEIEMANINTPLL